MHQDQGGYSLPGVNLTSPYIDVGQLEDKLRKGEFNHRSYWCSLSGRISQGRKLSDKVRDWLDKYKQIRVTEVKGGELVMRRSRHKTREIDGSIFREHEVWKTECIEEYR